MQLLRSGEGVRLSGDPVDVVVVEAPREAARGAATDLGNFIQVEKNLKKFVLLTHSLDQWRKV